MLRFCLGIIFATFASLAWGQSPPKAAKPTDRPETSRFDSKPALLRHDDEVLAVAYSPDGSILAVGTGDGTIRLWDASSGKQIATLTGHTDAAATVAFSHDGTRLASGSYDKTVRIWNVATRTLTATLKGHQNAVLAVAFLPAGTGIVSGGADRFIKVWDVAGASEKKSISFHDGSVRSLAVSPDGSIVAAAAADRRVSLWKTADWSEAGLLRGHKSGIRGVAFSPNGNLIATASDDNTVRLWDAAKAELKHELTGHTDAVTGLAFSPRGQLLATSSADKTLRLWETSTGGELAAFEEGHEESIAGIAFSPTGRQVATAGGDKAVGLWSATLPRVFADRSVNGKPGWTGVAAVSPDGQRIAAVGEKYVIHIHDATTGDVLATLRGHKGTIVQLAFTPDGGRLISVGRDRLGYFWDITKEQPLAMLDGHRGAVRAVAISPDGKTFATAGLDKRILVYDMPPPGSKLGELRERTAWEGHKAGIGCLAFSQDGKWLASGTDPIVRNGPAELKLWDVTAGSEAGSWNDHTAEITSLAFHPTLPLLVSGGADPGFRVWDLATKKMTIFRRTQTPVRAVAFTADGAELLTGSTGQAMLAWDIAAWHEQARYVGVAGAVTGLFIATTPERPVFSTGSDKVVRVWSTSRMNAAGVKFRGHESWVTSLALSPDGKKLYSGSWDGTFRIWDPETGKETGQIEAGEAKIFAIAISRDGKRAAAVGGNGEAFVFDLKSEQLLTKLDGYDEEAEVNGVAFTSDGKRVLTAGSDGQIRIWDAETGKEIAAVKGPKEGITQLALSPDDRHTIVAGSPGFACIVYDLNTKKELFRLSGHTAAVHTIVFTADGQFVVTGSADRTIRVWEAATGREVRKWDATSGVRGLVLSADGKTLVTVGTDRVNRMWNFATGRQKLAYEVHEKSALSVALSKDGTTIFSGAADTEIIRWRVPAAKDGK